MKRRSVMSPAEFAYFLGIPNIIMVQASSSEAKYGRFEPPFSQYTLALRPLERVVWSVVGSGGFTDPAETREVLEMIPEFPNIVGVMLDDFFTLNTEGKRAQWSVDELKTLRRQLDKLGRNLEIFVTLYYRGVGLPLNDYLELIDVITLWGGPADLPDLDTHLEKVEQYLPGKRKMLGCYLADYSNAEGLPVPLMKLQCEKGLQWLQQGRIEGMIFLGNTLADFGFESVEWVRSWIEKVGEQPIG
jgi:hypothetical protein